MLIYEEDKMEWEL